MHLSKPDPTSSPTTTCHNCNIIEHHLLHHVRHRGQYRRYCTNCTLKLHPQSFCPTCFQVYPPTPPNDAVFTCFKCYSSSHSHCVTGGPTPVPTPYTCPLCSHPNTPIFKMRVRGDSRVMDRDCARKLVAAARIAFASISKAAATARLESEKRGKEAAYARKRAKDALEHVAYLVVKEKMRKKENVVKIEEKVVVAFNAVELSGKVEKREEELEDLCGVIDMDEKETETMKNNEEEEENEDGDEQPGGGEMNNNNVDDVSNGVEDQPVVVVVVTKEENGGDVTQPQSSGGNAQIGS